MNTLLAITLVFIILLGHLCILAIRWFVRARAKSRRFEMYKAMLSELNHATPTQVIGFCWLIHLSCRDIRISRDIDQYPELMKYKPSHNFSITDGLEVKPTGWWFNPLDHDIRKGILREILYG